MKLFFCFNLCLVALSAKAQTFRPGTVTLNNGTTETGQIMVNERNGTPQRLFFRSATRSATQFGTSDLTAFELDRPDGKKERFMRKIASIDRSPLKPDASDLNASPKMEKDTFFCQLLTESTYSLYELRDGQGKTHYFMEKENLETLVRKQYYTFTTQGERKLTTNNQYQRQLLGMAKGCPNIKTNYGKLAYERAALMGVAAELNTCKNAPIRYLYKNEKNPVRFGLLAGASRTDVLLSKGATNAVQFNPSIQPTGGLYVLFFIPKTHRRVAIATEAMYRRQMAEGKTLDDLDPYLERIFTVDIQYARLNLLGRVSAHAFYGQIGLSTGYFFDNSSERTTRYFTPGTPQVVETEAWGTDANALELALLGGLGVQLGKRFSIEARFEYGNGFTQHNSDFSTRTQTLSLLAGYRIF